MNVSKYSGRKNVNFVILLKIVFISECCCENRSVSRSFLFHFSHQLSFYHLLSPPSLLSLLCPFSTTTLYNFLLLVRETQISFEFQIPCSFEIKSLINLTQNGRDKAMRGWMVSGGSEIGARQYSEHNSSHWIVSRTKITIFISRRKESKTHDLNKLNFYNIYQLSQLILLGS